MKKILLLTGCLLAWTTSGYAQNVLANGDFEKWVILEGNPPSGQPLSWGLGQSSSKPIRIPGFVRGSDYAAWMRPGDKNAMARGAQTAMTTFELDFYLVAEDPGSPTARSFNLSINEKGTANPTLNLRLVQGTRPGQLTLQAFNGKRWMTLAEDAMQASVYDAEKNTFPALHAYRLQLKVCLEGEGSYALAYGPENGELTRLTDLRDFQSPVTGAGLSGFSFVSGMSQAGFGIDNVSFK